MPHSSCQSGQQKRLSCQVGQRFVHCQSGQRLPLPYRESLMSRPQVVPWGPAEAGTDSHAGRKMHYESNASLHVQYPKRIQISSRACQSKYRWHKRDYYTLNRDVVSSTRGAAFVFGGRGKSCLGLCPYIQKSEKIYVLNHESQHTGNEKFNRSTVSSHQSIGYLSKSQTDS